MIKHYLCIIFVVTLTSCAMKTDNLNSEIISNIKILTQGNMPKDDLSAQYLCGNFTLTKEQVRNYYYQSRVTTAQEVHDNFSVFPCYSTGTIKINGENYRWKIRAGGLGRFYNNTKWFLRVCDKKCCEQTKGIC